MVDSYLFAAMVGIPIPERPQFTDWRKPIGYRTTLTVSAASAWDWFINSIHAVGHWDHCTPWLDLQLASVCCCCPGYWAAAAWATSNCWRPSARGWDRRLAPLQLRRQCVLCGHHGIVHVDLQRTDCRCQQDQERLPDKWRARLKGTPEEEKEETSRSVRGPGGRGYLAAVGLETHDALSLNRHVASDTARTRNLP